MKPFPDVAAKWLRTTAPSLQSSRMSWVWIFLLATELLEGQREAESCIPPPGAKNWAKFQPASQSSTYPQWGTVYSVAESAVDGDRDGDWSHGSCSHTTLEKEPWWSVDLGTRYAITAVVVKNRQDCCSERIKGAKVHVGDSIANYGKCNPVCGIVTNGSTGSLSIICCHGHKGRYVSVIIPGRAEYLTLCELEVYGSKLEDQC
ncbi:fucolectin-1-like [Rhineura floridana]|uniref:fucolectin-1-like n=1 Tax=Rhineura floridana TaxID=261503 RepID=UPI002AC8531F|nr:fucolectin-1-like [Rhineura floridana]